MISDAVTSLCGMFLLDFVWAKYTRFIAGGKVAGSVITSGGIILLSSWVTINYVQNHWMILPSIVGAMAGTWAGMKGSE